MELFFTQFTPTSDAEWLEIAHRSRGTKVCFMTGTIGEIAEIIDINSRTTTSFKQDTIADVAN